MSELVGIIDQHLAQWGVSEAAFARRIGAAPQTVNAWRKRGVKSLPTEPMLRGVATVTQTPYETVLSAALQDCGYLTGARTTGTTPATAPLSEQDLDDMSDAVKRTLLAGADDIYRSIQEASAEMTKLRKVPHALWSDRRTLRYLNAMVAAGDQLASESTT